MVEVMVEADGAILDAGSSGTRIHIYKWKEGGTSSRLPEVKSKKKWVKKIKPGVSKFHDHPTSIGPDHLQPLFSHALEIIPQSSIPETPLFLLATAGMRLLPERERQALLDEICTYARRNTQFLLPDCGLHIQVISGVTEGLYGWIAANYLSGGFEDPGHDHGKGHHTYGFLDMGGASAQIAFAPNATEAERHAGDLELLRMRREDGRSVEYKVFVTTWLGFGVNEARRRYVERLVEASAGDGVLELPDPCLHRGVRVSLEGKEIDDEDEDELEEVHLLGTGKWEECQRQVYPLLDKDKPCLDVPCLLNGIHVPAIDFDVNHFIGVSEYFHTTHEIFSDPDAEETPYDVDSYQARVKQFCGQSWGSIEDLADEDHWGKHINHEKLLQACFKASWLVNVLHDGIGIPRLIDSPKPNATSSDAADLQYHPPFRAVDKIHDVEVSWTLGKMLLYASSQIPPRSSSSDEIPLPVGFGKNILDRNGQPLDFEYASVSEREKSVGNGNGNEIEIGNGNGNYTNEYPSSHSETLWRDGDQPPRRIPGIILFLLIFLIATFLLLGRERRRKFYRSFGTTFGKKYRKILGSGGGITYERVDDGGENGFELGSVSGESDGSEEVGGWGKRGGYDPPVGGGEAGRLGLGGRTGSRERLAGRGGSRDVSPTRGGGATRARSPLPPR
ncbi:Golgi apyrase [Rhizina undulata]